MKKLVVNLQVELEVPDHAELREPIKDHGEMLFVHGRYLEPELTWQVLDEIEGDGKWTTVRLEDEKLRLMEGYLREVTRSEMRIEAWTDEAGEK